MPWKDTKPMDERVRLISDWLEGGLSVTELSGIYGVSRKSVYKWIGRYDENGVDGLKELCRAPGSHPNKTDEEVISRLIREKLKRMKWGPKKLLALLKANEPDRKWPSVATVEKWLKRNGLVRKRKRRRSVPPYSEPFISCDDINKVWSADYKGQFRTGDGQWCYPLTVSDNMSRYLLSCKGLYSPCYGDTRKWLEWTFREYGLPEAIRTDNGTPFAGRGVTALSRLSIWFIKLGIRPERIRAGKPQENGRHERMHRTLKDETAKPPGCNMNSQQTRFDRFKEEYNDIRPHESLGQRPPASVYESSPRRYPEKPRPVEYDDRVEVRSVRHSGEIKFKGRLHYLTELLYGENVGLIEINDASYEIRFGLHPIGVLDLKRGKVKPKIIRHKVLPMSIG